jgi:hypothetical protein
MRCIAAGTLALLIGAALVLCVSASNPVSAADKNNNPPKAANATPNQGPKHRGNGSLRYSTGVPARGFRYGVQTPTDPSRLVPGKTPTRGKLVQPALLDGQ